MRINATVFQVINELQLHLNNTMVRWLQERGAHTRGLINKIPPAKCMNHSKADNLSKHCIFPSDEGKNALNPQTINKRIISLKGKRRCEAKIKE